MSEETALLIERVSALLGDSACDVEGTLTDGYAGALALEGERVRLEDRFGELARALADDQGAEQLPELRSLRQRILRLDEDLSRLRGVLALARQRHAAVGAAASDGPLA
jgi:hypothetical protein